MQTQKEFITDVARIVGEEMHTMQSSAKKDAQYKRDFTTIQDRHADERIRSLLAPHFPGIPFYTEELGGNATTKGGLFVIDPIDGTNNYFGQDFFWGVSIALVENGATRIGAISYPGMDILVSAERDAEIVFEGHTSTGVSATTRLAIARVWNDWTKGPAEPAIHILRQLDRHTVLPEMRCSCTAAMLYVAIGRIDGYVLHQPQPFDIAAAGLIVEMAGGRVTDLEGNPWSPFSRSLVATNGRIHDDLLSILNG